MLACPCMDRSVSSLQKFNTSRGPFCIEFCSGTGGLAAQFRKYGMPTSFGVYRIAKANAKGPVIKLDSTDPATTEIVYLWLAHPDCAYVYLGIPCQVEDQSLYAAKDFQRGRQTWQSITRNGSTLQIRYDSHKHHPRMHLTRNRLDSGAASALPILADKFVKEEIECYAATVCHLPFMYAWSATPKANNTSRRYPRIC